MTLAIQSLSQAIDKPTLQPYALVSESVATKADRVAGDHSLIELIEQLRNENQQLKQQVQQLTLNNEYQHQLIDAMPTGVIILNGDGIVIKANAIAIDLLDEPILNERWSDVIQRSFKPRADDWHEVSLKDGRRVKLAIQALANQPGQLITITDLTETRLLQDKISQMQRLSSLGRMVSSLAHQIRTPLSAAMLYAANLNNHQLASTERDKFQQKLMARLADLEAQVNDMLLFAKSGREQIVDTISMRDIVRQTIESMDAKIKQHQASIQLFDLNPEQSDLLLGNKNAIQGALQNLIDNAIQAVVSQPEQPKPEIEITLAAHPEALFLTVQDNGPGIKDALRETIFEPFVTSRTNGTGLGLAVVKAVAQSHKGDVALLPSNVGACFCMKFPALPVSEQFNSNNLSTPQEQAND
jgi:two-component system sensor histidine kinase FlrB